MLGMSRAVPARATAHYPSECPHRSVRLHRVQQTPLVRGSVARSHGVAQSFAAVAVQYLPKAVQPAVELFAPSVDPSGRQTLQVRVLWQRLLAEGAADEPQANAHRRATLYVSGVWQKLRRSTDLLQAQETLHGEGWTRWGTAGRKRRM